MPTERIQPGLYRGNGVNNRADVLVGNPDRYGTKVGPQLRASRFGGRVSMGLDCDDVEPTDIQESLDGNTLIMDMSRGTGPTGRKGEQHRVYRFLDEQDNIEKLEYEIDWENLAAVPANRKVTFSLAMTSGAEAYFQPALTPEQIADGSYRPPHIVGSYQFYWNQAGRFMRGGEEIVNYETGKIMSAECPFLYNEAGDICRCSQLIHGSGVNRKITYDFSSQDCEDFLQASPTKRLGLGPTFGYTSDAGSQITNNSNQCTVGSGLTYTAVAGATITGFSFLGRQRNSPGGNVELAAYSLSGTLPQNRLATAEIINVNNTTKQWWTVSGLSQAMSPGTTYGMATAIPASTKVYRFWDSGSGNNNATDSTSDPNLAAVWVHNNYLTLKWGQYATYEVVATGSYRDYEYYYRHLLGGST